jgi:hypothetical protein
MKNHFFLGGQIYTVELVDMLGVMQGRCSEVHGKIEIESRDDLGGDIPKDHLSEVLFHELVHLILLKMKQYSLSDDKGFVNTFAVFLNQFFASYWGSLKILGTENGSSKLVDFLTHLKDVHEADRLDAKIAARKKRGKK